LLDRFDAVFFDNDGILVDTEPLFLEATREILATVGVEVTAADYHEISMRKGGTVFDLASEQGISDDEILRLRGIRGQRYSELIRAGVRVLDGVVGTMEALQSHRPSAIVTSSAQDHFDEIHSQTGLIPYFEFVLTAADYKRHKPHPEGYLAAAAKMGVDPARSLVIEDTERGLVSARAAGMECVVIPNALTASANFEGALARLDSMEALPELLGLA